MQREADMRLVEANRSAEIRDDQMNGADSRGRIDARGFVHLVIQASGHLTRDSNDVMRK